MFDIKIMIIHQIKIWLLCIDYSYCSRVYNKVVKYEYKIMKMFAIYFLIKTIF